MTGADRRGIAPGIAPAALVALFLQACASQVAPTGGPPDTAAPAVAATSPAQGELNVGGGKIAVEFTEYVDRRTLQESAYLSPAAGLLTYDWSGTSVEITHADTLRPGTTYILTIGTDLKDSRGNRMEEAFTLSFSTGPSIDSCSVAGIVDDPAPGGVMVYAYALTEGRGDTLDPRAVKPDYLTQTGRDGSFTIRNMKEGAYRLVAVRDLFRNLLYDVQADQYGMAASDVRCGTGERSVAGIGFRLSSEDTLRPFLSGARAGNNSSIALKFNEPVLIPGGASSVLVVDTATGLRLDVLALAPSDSTFREYHAATRTQDSGAVYRVSLADLADIRGNRSDSAGRGAVFPAGEGIDSLPPAMASNVPRDSLTGFLPTDTLRLRFTEPVDTAAFAAGFRVTSSDGSPVAGRLRWTGSMAAAFVAEAPYVQGAWYALAATLDSLRDAAGRCRRDSTLVRRFRIAEERTLSGISGRVAGSHGTPGVPSQGAPIVVEAKTVGGGGATFRAVADGSGDFVIGSVPGGLYLLSAFVDLDGDGMHDSGRPFPARFAEPFGLHGDTLRVRPRWPVEGVRIDIGR